jgi:hypothetical protein
MIEIIVTVIISVSAILLFCYWFRYTCLLILSAATPRDYATSFAQSYQLGFQNAQLQLSQGVADLGQWKATLDHDYAVLARLLNQAENTEEGIERRMLAIHYRLAAIAYRFSSSFSTSVAHRMLEEMCMVVAYFANSLGEASASPTAA